MPKKTKELEILGVKMERYTCGGLNYPLQTWHCRGRNWKARVFEFHDFGPNGTSKPVKRYQGEMTVFGPSGKTLIRKALDELKTPGGAARQIESFYRALQMSVTNGRKFEWQ